MAIAAALLDASTSSTCSFNVSELADCILEEQPGSFGSEILEGLLLLGLLEGR